MRSFSRHERSPPAPMGDILVSSNRAVPATGDADHAACPGMARVVWRDPAPAGRRAAPRRAGQTVGVGWGQWAATDLHANLFRTLPPTVCPALPGYGVEEQRNSH